MKKNYLLGIFSIIVLCSCSFSFSEEDLEVSPDVFEIPPNKLEDTSSSIYYNQFSGQIISFDFEKDLEDQEIPESEWQNIRVVFTIEDADYYNQADNNLSYAGYYAMINGQYAKIPKPVGFLDKYEIVPDTGQTVVFVRYTASDVSGIYKIWGSIYYKGELIGKKYSKAIVKIPYLIEVSRD